MARRKVKKTKIVIDPAAQAKIKALDELLATFRVQAAEYEKMLNIACGNRCAAIEKAYKSSLKAIPENIRNMTIAELMTLREKERARETECPKDENAIRMQHDRKKMTSERKRTQKKERKRSISVPTSGRGLSISHASAAKNPPLLTRAISEFSLLTPSRNQRKASMAVTPKFNPKYPVLMARKPKPGEVLMSLTGSPLHNYMDDLPPEKPAGKITLSLGQGKVITFDDEEISTDKEFIKSIDEPLKATLTKVQEQLNKILQGNND